jgi:hypothetical protein
VGAAPRLEICMTKSLFFAALLAASLGACGWILPAPSPTPTPDTANSSLVSGFVPYCGPVWSVGKQGYVNLPCPPGSNYPGAGAN